MTLKNWIEYKKQIGEGILPGVINIIEEEQLRTPNRTRHIAHQRYFLMWFLRRNTQMTLSQIGNLFLKDHSSVIHGIKYHEESVEINCRIYFLNIQSIKTFLEKILDEIPHST